jgi:hypothetical protein
MNAVPDPGDSLKARAALRLHPLYPHAFAAALHVE